MALKKLRQFIRFDWEGFAKGKVFIVTGCALWKDYDTKQILGTKVNAAIVRDETHYESKNGEQVTNCFNTLAFKIPKQISVPVNANIQPVGVVATVYGEYMNQLSIKCTDIQILKEAAK